MPGFDWNGKPLGVVSEDRRIVDPRGLAVAPREQLVLVNSSDRVLALDAEGKVVRETGVIEGLNPGGGTFGPDDRYYIGLRTARTILALPVSPGAAGQPWRCRSALALPVSLNNAGEPALPAGIVPFSARLRV